MRRHAANVIVIQAPDHAVQLTLELCPPDLVRSDYDSSSLFTAASGDDDPLPNREIIPVWSKVVDAPGITEANPSHTLGRRGVVEPENGVTFSATAFADLFARLESALEALASASTGLVERRRRRPGSV
jgi:hypothetical protein